MLNTLRSNFERPKKNPVRYVTCDWRLKALHRLRQLPELGADAGKAALDPANCLVIEDAPAGVRAAHAAGMKCLALAHTRPLVELRHADWARRDFGEVDLEEIARAFQNSGE